MARIGTRISPSGGTGSYSIAARNIATERSGDAEVATVSTRFRTAGGVVGEKRFSPMNFVVCPL